MSSSAAIQSAASPWIFSCGTISLFLAGYAVYKLTQLMITHQQYLSPAQFGLTSSVGHVLSRYLGERAGAERRLRAGLQQIRSFAHESAELTLSNYVAINFEEWRNKESELLNALTVLATLNADATAASSGRSQPVPNHIVIYFSGEPDAIVKAQVFQLRDKLRGLVFDLVSANSAEDAFKKAQLNLSADQNSTVLTLDASVAPSSSINVVLVQGSADLAIATFAYAATKDPIRALKILRTIFENVFHLDVHGRLTDKIVIGIVAAINA